MIWHRFICVSLLIVAIGGGARAEDRGAYLARIGDCVSCHTASSGEPFAGGRRMPTPLGAIFTTNITPDRETGIGTWSLADFTRALRRGIARDGHHLYPAMPYPSYARVSDADIAALYRYFMTEVPAVRRVNRQPEIPWPLDRRWPLALWNALFLRDGIFQPRPDRDALWNHGAYLVEGLGHCGACHTPRGLGWNERGMEARDPLFLTGETLDYWSAPNLRGDPKTGLGAWSAADIVAFLKAGHGRRVAAYGAMRQVVGNSTRFIDDADLAAIATYLKSLTPADAGEHPYRYDDTTRQRLAANPAASPGTVLYLGHCASCHGADGMGQPPRIPRLAGNPSVLGHDATSAIHVVLDGAGPAEGSHMPGFRSILSDEQIAAVVSFIRQAWGNGADGIDPAAVSVVRVGTAPSPDRIAHGASLIATRGCGACHAISGIAGATGLAGPPLDTMGSRATIAGLLANTPENMASWLENPQRVKPGNAMPNIGLRADEAEDIAAFLATRRGP